MSEPQISNLPPIQLPAFTNAEIMEMIKKVEGSMPEAQVCDIYNKFQEKWNECSDHIVEWLINYKPRSDLITLREYILLELAVIDFGTERFERAYNQFEVVMQIIYGTAKAHEIQVSRWNEYVKNFS